LAVIDNILYSFLFNSETQETLQFLEILPLFIFYRKKLTPWVARQPRTSADAVLRLHFSRSIPKKFLLLLHLIFFTTTGIIIVSGLSHRRDAIREAERKAVLLVESPAAQQEQIVTGTGQMLTTLAQLPEVQGGDEDACNKLFREILDRNSLYANLLGITPDGSLFAASEPFEIGSIHL
jgi:hypothetical protein